MTRLTRLFFFLFLTGFSVFLGGSVIRTAIAYNVFVPGTLNLKDNLPNEFFTTSIALYSATAIYTTVSYTLCFATAILLLLAFRHSLRRHGWLLMSYVLFFLVSPVHFVQFFYEYRIYEALQNQRFTEALQHFLRFFEIGGLATMLANFSYLTIFLLVAWRPLERSKGVINED